MKKYIIIIGLWVLLTPSVAHAQSAKFVIDTIGEEAQYNYDFYASNPASKSFFAGKVSIGIQDPGVYQLNVSGKLNATEICINGLCNSSWPSDVWSVDAGGNANYQGGKVGIGTNTPQAQLHVESAAGEALRVVQGTLKALVIKDGKVGIGLATATDPSRALDVAGVVKATNFIRTCVGYISIEKTVSGEVRQLGCIENSAGAALVTGWDAIEGCRLVGGRLPSLSEWYSAMSQQGITSTGPEHVSANLVVQMNAGAPEVVSGQNFASLAGYRCFLPK